MKKDITLYYNAVCKEHSYDNGFCTKCGGYQPADYNESTGNYEIGNGGQMFWFAALVNGDGEHTLIQEAKPDAHGVLVSDISLKNPVDENYEWKPIGEFKGIFDGQNHTISDFSMTKVNDQSIGFFQSLMSDPNETDEAKKATLKNFRAVIIDSLCDCNCRISYEETYDSGYDYFFCCSNCTCNASSGIFIYRLCSKYG